MIRRSATRNGLKIAASIGKASYRTTGKVIDHLIWWSTTDHLGIGRSLSQMPRRGFIDSLVYLAWTLFAGLVGALVAGITASLLIVYGIPLVIHVLFFL